MGKMVLELTLVEALILKHALRDWPGKNEKELNVFDKVADAIEAYKRGHDIITPKDKERGTIIDCTENCLDRSKCGTCSARHVEWNKGRCSGKMGGIEAIRAPVPTNFERKHGVVTQKHGSLR